MEEQTVTACPVVQDVPALIAFLTRVFGATETEKPRIAESAGGCHAELQIGDTVLMAEGGTADFAWTGEIRPMAFHFYVPDTDATYSSALANGAQSLEAPADQEWGERTAAVKDPSGNFWYIATFQGEHYYSEGAPTVQPFLQPGQGGPLIDFLVKAFGATELGRAASPEGAILHTTLKIGNSALELFDAHGIYQPMPGVFYLRTEDAEAAFSRAVNAGADPVFSPASPPEHQGQGDRTGSVRDIAGNLWHIGLPIRL